MKARIVRAVLVALFVGLLALAGTAPFGDPSPLGPATITLGE